MLHAGLDLSRRRVDVCLLDEAGEVVAETAAPPDADGLRRLARRLGGQRVPAVIESMTGARFVHDTLEEHGWEVLVAVAQKVKGLAPLRARPTRSTRTGGSRLSRRRRSVRPGRRGSLNIESPLTIAMRESGQRDNSIGPASRTAARRQIR
jgi:transposase